MNSAPMISGGTGNRNPIFGYSESSKKNPRVYDYLVAEGFSLFFANLLVYFMIFQSFEAPLAHSTLKNHKIYPPKIGTK